MDAGSALGAGAGTLAAATGSGLGAGLSAGAPSTTTRRVEGGRDHVGERVGLLVPRRCAGRPRIAAAGMSGSGSVAAGSEPSSARATDGKATADAPASAAAAMHVATRALSMETMHFHLCIELTIFIHHFTRLVLDIVCVSRYVSSQKGWWIGSERIGGRRRKCKGGGRMPFCSPPITAGATGAPGRASSSRTSRSSTRWRDGSRVRRTRSTISSRSVRSG